MVTLVTIFGTYLSNEEFGVFLVGGITFFGIGAACMTAVGKEDYVFGFLVVVCLAVCIGSLLG